MQNEIEAKFLDVDFDTIRAALQKSGATCVQPMRLMRRTIMDYPDERLQSADSYIRVRDEGGKVTLTYKKFDSLSVDGAKEISVVVDDYEATCHLLTAIGLEARATQESKRETWELNEVEIVLDEWPWLKPYIEIEGPDEQSIRRVAQQLGLDWKDAVFGDVSVAFTAEYDVTMEQVGKSSYYFDQPVPDWLESKRK